MEAKVTRSFRVAVEDGTRKYTPGEVAEGRAAEVAVENGWGEAIAPAEKKKPAPKNKAVSAAPKNKAG